MNRTAPEAPVTTTVAGLSDRRLVQRLKELTAVEHQLEVVVIDHLRELERRRLYLSRGFSSLFDYATRELGYSEAAAWRRIKAMRLCGEVEGARERMRDGSLTLNSAALLQNAFDRQERKRSGGGRGAQAGVRPPAAPDDGAPTGAPIAPAHTGERAEEPSAAPTLDSSARQALVKQAAGKSTRQVEQLLAGVDPELAAPADRMRPLGAGRWELKAVIGDECRQGLEQLRGLLSHVDPHMTLGQIVERAVREAVERHDPARPPRGRRTGSRAASSGADETSAPKDTSGPDATAAQPNATPAGATGETSAPKDASGPDATAAQPNAKPADRAGQTSAPKDTSGPDATAAQRNATPAGATGETSAPKDSVESDAAAAQPNATPAECETSPAKAQADSVAAPARPTATPIRVTTSPAKEPADISHLDATAAERSDPAARTGASALKDTLGPDSATAEPAPRKAAPAGCVTSPAKAQADCEHGRDGTRRSARPSAPKAGCGRQRQAAPLQSQVRSRAIPMAVKRYVWERDRGCCSYVDGASGRRCGSRRFLQIDHILPFALGGSAEPDNLRLLCAAHHRHRHANQGSGADRAAARP